MNTFTALSRWVTFVLAVGAGFSVAAIYYAQPLLPLMGQDLNLSITGMGLVPTLTQAGYALGILFLLPLGDRYDRRTLILLKSISLAVLLLACSFTGQLHSLLIVSLLMGMAATMAQDIVPAAAILAPEGKQGKTVGTVMTGLLLGILLSRTVSGLVGEAFGWREMYQLAARQYCRNYHDYVESTASFYGPFHVELSIINALDGATLATIFHLAPRSTGTRLSVHCF